MGLNVSTSYILYGQEVIIILVILWSYLSGGPFKTEARHLLGLYIYIVRLRLFALYRSTIPNIYHFSDLLAFQITLRYQWHHQKKNGFTETWPLT